MTQWHDERDKGERDRGITRWDEETGVIMDFLKSKGRFLPFIGYLRHWRWEKKEGPNQIFYVQRQKTKGRGWKDAKAKREETVEAN